MPTYLAQQSVTIFKLALLHLRRSGSIWPQQLIQKRSLLLFLPFHISKRR